MITQPQAPAASHVLDFPSQTGLVTKDRVQTVTTVGANGATGATAVKLVTAARNTESVTASAVMGRGMTNVKGRLITHRVVTAKPAPTDLLLMT